MFRRLASLGARCLPEPLALRLDRSANLCLLFHAVSEEPLPHVRHLYRVMSPREFTASVERLLQRFDPMDPGEVAWFHTRFRRPKVLITFDDGLRENAEVVAPILCRLGVPAIFFVCTGAIDNRMLLERMKHSLILDRLQSVDRGDWTARGKPRHGDGPNSPEPNRPNGRQGVGDDAWGVRRFDRATEALGFSFVEYLERTRPYLTWQQVEALAAQGFHIGGHSVTHPCYESIPEDEQIAETVHSMRAIRLLQVNHVKRHDRFFAFPFFMPDLSERFFEETGSSVDYYFSTEGSELQRDPRIIPRVGMDGLNWGEKALRRAYCRRFARRLRAAVGEA